MMSASPTTSKAAASGEQDAARFEKYLKSGSGRAFAKRHFRAPPGCRRRSPDGTACIS
jgi:hypothetical protein